MSIGENYAGQDLGPQPIDSGEMTPELHRQWERACRDGGGFITTADR